MRSPGNQYRILLHGQLDQRWADWFGGFDLIYQGGSTLLTGPVADQAALHGLLAKIRDLGLVIISVELIRDADRPEDGSG